MFIDDPDDPKRTTKRFTPADLEHLGLVGTDFKFVVSDAMADRWIAAGVATEAMLIRQKPIPIRTKAAHNPRKPQ